MNRNYLAGFAAAAVLIFLLAYAVYSLFEISPRSRFVPPSREARVNEYLALDRWLESFGIPVRIESSGNLSTILRADERQIFVQTSLFRWNHDAIEYLVRWIEEGGSLFLVLDNIQSRNDDESVPLLEKFGIKAEAVRPDYRSDSDLLSGACPGYDDRVFFEVWNDEALALKDWSGLTRLVQVKRGKGGLTVTGEPVFLYSPYHGDGSGIGDAPNARLAWAFFVEPCSSESGWLFIRGTAKVSGLFGSLWRHGNLTVLLVSALVLLVTGFWTVIPMFGLVHRGDERPGRPLRERFLAEGHFYRKYGALDFYRSVYISEIKRRLTLREGLVSGDETERRLLSFEQPVKKAKLKKERRAERDLLLRALRGEPFMNREFVKMIIIFRSILERI